MGIAELLAGLIGAWTGTNHLWFRPGEPGFESPTTVTVAPTAQGTATLLQYTWSHEGTPHAGAMLILHQATTAEQDAVTWVDSFHTAAGLMHFRGGMNADGTFSVIGSYGAPEGPPWGWRIVLTPAADGQFTMRMYNITPDGQEVLAVEATYRKSA
ncbi:MAG TPA: DUF1579 family protein [Gemmatimonadales bacterium]|nr:DUF1579 family protein [Gemmatimonadales bacterium]